MSAATVDYRPVWPYFSLVFATLVSFVSHAAPRIEFDSKTFNCGTVVEGKTEKINAVFVVKNTGDAALKLEKVRPGCGCTVVKYDSLIQPGKSTKIESAVNIKGYRSGPISKSITVTSNAENEPTARLVIEATIQAPVELSESYLNIDISKNALPKKIFLSTKKSGLKITSIDFRSTEHNKDIPVWQTDVPVALKYKLATTDSVRSDGYKVYELHLFSPEIDKPSRGQITIKTNHSEKPELSVRAFLRM